MKNCLYIVAIFVATFFFAGCQDHSAALENLPIQSKSVTITDEKIPVSVFWDATISMQGFTVIEPMNVYRTLPDELENICSSVATLGNVNFYRFGETTTLIDRNSFRQFADPAVYTELITSMSNAVDTAEPNHLSIVVTDLFESNADWSLISQRIKEKIFEQHLAVAVIGIKNPFQGKIFDVGITAENFSYSTGGDPSRFRPFYLFVFGNENVVKNFLNRFEHFRRQQVINNEIEYIIFSEHLTDSAGTFETMKITASENIFEAGNFLIDNPTVREFGINSSTDKSSLTFEFHYKPTLGALSIDRSKLSSRFLNFSYDDDKLAWIQESKLRSDAKFSLTEDPNSTEPGHYLLTFEFTPQNILTADKLNLIQASLLPMQNSYDLPSWVYNWNMMNVDLNPNSFDGTKTVNLLHILDSLMDANLSSNLPTLVELNLLIEY